MTHKPINFKEIFKLVLIIVLFALAIKGSFVCWNVFTQGHAVYDPQCQPHDGYFPNCPAAMIVEYTAVWKYSVLILNIFLWVIAFLSLALLKNKKEPH